MQKIMTNVKTNIYLGLWLLMIAIIAYLVPYYSNDFRYMLIEGTEDKISSLSDIAISQYRHYFTWGGRTPPHVLAQLLLLGGKVCSSLMVAFCYALFIYMCSVFAKGRLVNPLKLSFGAVFMITMLLWFCLRSYGEVVFMLVSSCNYLYTTTFILCYLTLWHFSLLHEVRCTTTRCLVMFLLGIIAGWCNENTGFAICTATGLVSIYHFYKKSLKPWMVCSLLGLGIGFLLLVLSPGNAARMQYMEQGNYNYFTHLFKNVDILLLTLLENLPLMLLLGYFVRKVYVHGLAKDHKNFLYALFFVITVAVLSLLIMCVSPNFPARSTAPFTMFLIVAAVCVYEFLKEHKVPLMSTPRVRIVEILCLALCLATMVNLVFCLEVAREDALKEKEVIMSQINEGKKDLVLPVNNVKKSRYLFISEARVDKNYYVNRILSRYYHVDSVTRPCYAHSDIWHSDLRYFNSYGEKVCQTY